MGATRFMALACLVVALVPGRGRALSSDANRGGTGEIGIDAEQISYDQKANVVTARGKVVITRGQTELRADEVRLNRATNEAEARGNVSVTDPEGTLFADAMTLNLDEETGSLDTAAVESRRFHYSLSGDHIEKGLGQSYHIENGRFTTCHCNEGPPSWSISGKEVNVDLSGVGRLKGGTFNVLDVPVLYLPQAVFPVQRDRQSGFLLPRVGISNTRGFQTLLPYYLAISKSQDATLALDVETSARVGVVGEYRYAVSRETGGVLNASYFNESFRGTTQGNSFENTIPHDRWSVGGTHVQPFIGTSQAYGDVFLVSDDLFLREINTYAFEHARDVAIRTLPFTQSHVGVVQLWNRVGLNIEGTYYQNLEGPDSQTLQRAPEVDLLGQSRLGEYVLGDLSATAVDFQRGSAADGLRVDVEPSATVPLPLGRFAFGAIRTSVRETAYHLNDDELSSTGAEVPRNQSRELFQVNAEMGTTLDRIYPFHWLGLEKIKHTIEPTLAYLYIPAVAQGDIPIFDGVDRVNRRNLITYGVVSRFLGKFADDGDGTNAPHNTESVREIGRLSLLQSADLTRDLAPLQPDRTSDHFSDLDIGGRVNPSRYLSFRFNANYDTGDNSMTAAKVGFFIEDPRNRSNGNQPRLETRTSAGVSYRFLNQNVLQEIDDNIVLRVTDWAGFLYSSRYDVVNNRFLDNFFGLRLISMCDCWALDLAVTDRTNPQEVEFRAQLTLAGFGPTKRGSRVAAMP